MTVLEQKVDALAELALARTDSEKRTAMQKLRNLMEMKQEAEGTGEQDAEDITRRILAELGCPDGLIGHRYAVYAIGLGVEDPKVMDNLSELLYPDIEKRFDTTGTRVERAIRHMIDVAWCRADPDAVDRYFGNTVDPEKGRPTVKAFLVRITYIVRKKMKTGRK